MAKRGWMATVIAAGLTVVSLVFVGCARHSPAPASSPTASMSATASTSAIPLPARSLAPTGPSSRLSVGPTGTTPVPIPTWLVGDWFGHTRHVTFDSNGGAQLRVDDGCCTLIIQAGLRITTVSGDAHAGQASGVLTTVQVGTTYTSYLPGRPVPHPGQKIVLTANNGIITDSLLKATFCDTAKRNSPGGYVCGA